MKVGIIILNWNGWKDTQECLKSLVQITYSDFFVTVIDNGSDNNEAQRIISEFGKFARVISLPKNLGYARGNNFGIQHSLKEGAEAVLLLNNDVVADKNFLNFLVNKLKEDRVGIVGPKILYYHEKNRIWYGGGTFHWWTGLAFHYGEGKLDSPAYNKTREVSFITGCSMLIKKEVFEKIGYLDEEYQLYWEDADFCYRTFKKCFSLWYVPESRIWHKVSRTIGEGSPKRSYLVTKSRILFMKKHLSKLQWLIFATLFTFYKIPLKIFHCLHKGRIENLKAFFIGIKDGLINSDQKFK
ncbi:MAG: glycosyltransferase family 2 protein [Candidatus Kerfeldbacteria bacterium CG_4_10_14_0_8_um_filter_42_10]|uniref:Glycosyltransferase family 2 protein n=1 Tax=Candidatus Kerfeldbacteria bacterium CG_4_10_14_0_8_um_filter_42_10 TaxID=2014248 RepID=A0A2M7RL73_9BACT|nr:MAG: glycosyltransferase family 2 protein [Candidatus Kerfeldbacteria bacterium CG_4_10_14_0_8_um_filter_42_10]